jgi:hypothetical protein
MKFGLDIFGKTGRRSVKDQYAKCLKCDAIEFKDT